MRLAHISDFHFTHLTLNPLKLIGKRLLGHANWILRRDREFRRAQVDPLPSLLRELKVDLVLLGGDFTTTALREEFEIAARFVDSLKLPWIAIPGNHDHYTKQGYRRKDYYRYFTNKNPARGSLAEERVEVHRLAPQWWVVALDTAQPTSWISSQGLFHEKLEQRLEEELQRIPRSQGVILLNHYPFFPNDALHRRLVRGEALEQLIRRHPHIRLYLHGHTHRHIFADLQSDGLPLLLDSGSCTQEPIGTWNLLDLNEKGCTVHVFRWHKGWYKDASEEVLWKR